MFDRSVNSRDVAQHARPERDFIERHAIAAHGGLRFSGADDVIPRILVEVGARLPHEFVKVLKGLVACAQFDVPRWPDRFVHGGIPPMSMAAIVDPSGIASQGFTPSQNCMAYWRRCLTVPGFSGFAAYAFGRYRPS